MVVVDRPAVPDTPVAATVAEAVTWVESFGGGMIQG